MWRNIISPLNDCHRVHNSYAHSHRYLSSVSVNTTSCSPSAHCCSLRKNSTCALAYEVPTYLSKISLHIFFSSLCYHLCLHWPSSSFWLCQAPILPQDLSRAENTLFSPWQLRGDFLTPRWVRPCYNFSLHFMFLYQTIFHKGNCSSILRVWIFNVSLICGSIYIYIFFFLFPFLCVCARMTLDLSENLPLSLHSFHQVDTRKFFLKTKGIAPLRVGKHAFCQKGGAICIPMTDSCWCMAETNTAFIVKQLSSN